MNVGSLFAGIGGFDLGFERAGMRTLWQVEQNPYCRAVLAQHFPDAERFEDVCEVGARELAPVDLICGGFPCTDLSRAKHGRLGLDGPASGLWSEMFRIAGEIRPRYLVVENVADLLADGMGRVLGDLVSIGYDAEWDVLPASAFGAPHRRERVWIVAYPHAAGLQGLHDAGGRVDLQPPPRDLRRDWPPEPPVDRVANGVPRRLVRPDLEALGNALVPQIAQWIGERILTYESEAATQKGPIAA